MMKKGIPVKVIPFDGLRRPMAALTSSAETGDIIMIIITVIFFFFVYALPQQFTGKLTL